MSSRLPAWPVLPVTFDEPHMVVDVVSMPHHQGHRQLWVAKVVDANHRQLIGHRVWVSIYQSRPVIGVGERWSLAMMGHAINRHDESSWAQWCRQRGIVSTVVVDAHSPMIRLSDGHRHPLLHYRNRIAKQIDAAIPQHDVATLMTAITVGVRQLSATQWQVLQRTGSAHLLAVSGLHVALVAWVVYRAVFVIAGCWMRLERHGYLPWVAETVSVSVAAIYGLVSGWAIPVQRAWLMLLLMMAMRVTRWHLTARQRLGMALMCVLLVTPNAWQSASLWLSFTAVACLIYSAWGEGQAIPWWRSWWSMQWALIIGLLPLEAYFFGQMSWVAPLVNVIAIPWFSMVALPSSLLALIVASIFPHIASACWQLAAWGVMPLWFFLSHVSAWVVTLPLVGQSSWQVMGWAVACALILSPRLLRWQGVGWCLLVMLGVCS